MLGIGWSGWVAGAYGLALFSLLCVPVLPAIAGLILAGIAFSRRESGVTGALAANAFALLLGVLSLLPLALLAR